VNSERETVDNERVEKLKAVRGILRMIGEDPNREGLIETPRRVVDSWAELFGGYDQKVEDVMTVFQDTCDEMVILRNVEFYSTCEHHMLPFTGVAHIAYLPQDKVIGVSKLARILEIYSRRLQIQERLCSQVAEALMAHLDPRGAACLIESKHLCMTCRGVNKQQSTMVTSCMLGAFKSGEPRSEFLSIVKG
jgi:GTP cyclohydrolase I